MEFGLYQRTFVDEAVCGSESSAVGLPAVCMKLYNETALGRVETSLSSRQSPTEFEARRLRLSHLRTLQIQEQPNIISTPGISQ